MKKFSSLDEDFDQFLEIETLVKSLHKSFLDYFQRHNSAEIDSSNSKNILRSI